MTFHKVGGRENEESFLYEFEYRKGDVMEYMLTTDCEALGEGFDLDIIEPQGRLEKVGQE